MRKLAATLILLAFVTPVLVAQEALSYQKPPKEILELADFEHAPSLMRDSKLEYVVFAYRSTYKLLAELSEQEMKLGGLRVNPKTNISSATTYSNNLKYRKFKDTEVQQVEGVPKDARLANFVWSPNETMMAFTNTTSQGVELWYFELATGKARKLTNDVLNANAGRPFSWLNNQELLVRELPKNRPAIQNTDEVIPTGPTVSVSDKGAKAQNMTYQDLLKDATDEANFETLLTAELYKVDLSGNKTLWKEKDIYTSEIVSPDGSYVMVSSIHRPYSYLVPCKRFPTSTKIYDASGKLAIELDDSPLLEVLPKGFMATKAGKRNFTWRSDKPATVCWVEALDGGDPEVKVDYRDEVFELDAPFTGKPQGLAKVVNRFAGVIWGNSQVAILYDAWWNTRMMRTYIINPSKPEQAAVLLNERNMQDTYSNPGNFDTKRNQYGRYVLNLDGDFAYLIGEGFTEKGQFPFVDELNLTTKATKRLYQSTYTDKKIEILSIINAKKGELLAYIQSPTEYPNYFLLNTKKRMAPIQLTHFENPFRSIAGVYKEVIRYQRPDGTELSATLYLPVGYDMKKKEKLPMLMWAYPQEFKDKSSAGQLTTNPNEFIYPHHYSPVYWVTRGYAVLDDTSFPIVGEGDTEPNDTFVEQLVANAKAAIDAVDAMGYVDRNRVAVGGHSYGAFMTANLLTHSDLFAAGIARSGAYNRTLTPFGFQSEERNYWEAPNVYNTMSPFQTADKMKYPLLIIHGANDNNTGTYTMQSERYFNALKGLGAPARLVLLPKESHGYEAKESVLHILWEQDQWLETYVKNKK